MEFLEVKGVTKFFGGLKALWRISFEVRKGDVLGIIGPNGAGKTTLFNVISGFYRLDEGKIHLNGKAIQMFRPDEICKLGVTRTFQIVRPFSSLSVLDNVTIGALVRTPQVKEARKKAMEILELVHLHDRSGVITKNLTLADMKRLEVAKALATEPQILMMDESMAGLTPTEANQTIELIHKLRDRGLTFILIEHVMEITMNLSNRIVVLNYGEKIAEGTPKEVAHDEKVIEAYLGREDHAENR